MPLPKILQPKNPAHSAISMPRALKNILKVLEKLADEVEMTGDAELEDSYFSAKNDINTMLENVE